MGFSRQEYWSGCHFLLQGIFPTQGSNPGLPHFGQILYYLSPQETKMSELWLLCTLHRDIVHVQKKQSKTCSQDSDTNPSRVWGGARRCAEDTVSDSPHCQPSWRLSPPLFAAGGGNKAVKSVPFWSHHLVLHGSSCKLGTSLQK